MDGTLQFRNIGLSGVNSSLAFVAVLRANVQLLIECTSTIDQSVALLLKDGDARALSEALLFPF